MTDDQYRNITVGGEPDGSASGAAAPAAGTPTSGTPALEFSSVVKRFGSGTTEVRALTDINLTVQPGEFVAVMGPSGSVFRG
jgi:putative ABC transport system ATP-binding protein